MSAKRFEIDDKIGRLTILEFLGTDHAQKRLVKCICDCGNIVTTRLGNLKNKTNSCGCLRADLIRERMGKSIEHLAVTHVFNSCKRHTKDTNLSFEDVKNMIYANCYYCEQSPNIVGTSWHRPIPDGREIKRIGIDRINSQSGYYKGNVVPCCKTCNMLKRDYKVDFLISKLEIFLKNLKLLRNINE